MVTVVIDYDDLHRRLNDAPCGRNQTALVSVDCHGNRPISFARLAGMPGFAYLALVLVLVCWCGYFFVRIRGLPYMRGVREFYEDTLKIDHRMLQTIQWDTIMDKLVESQKKWRNDEGVAGHITLDKLALTHLITRRTNYICAMFNANILTDAITLSLPCLGKRVVMTKYSEAHITTPLPLFNMVPRNMDLRCVLPLSTGRCWVKNMSRIQY